MKKSELKMLIREIVREEVRMELRSFLKESKMNKRKQSTSQPKKSSKNNEVNYTKNKVLNGLLNETAHSSEDWETMGGSTFTADSMRSILNKNYGDVMNRNSNAAPNVMDGEMLANAGVNDPDALPEHLTKALTRDYSELMGTINKKKNGDNV